MPTLVRALGLIGNPFEHYVAEQEPDITDYAVKPPYFEAIDARVRNTSSFILFGERGAGKSATRLTIFKELWKGKAEGNKVPFVVNMTDFSEVVDGKQISHATEAALVSEAAFVILESLLTWLSSLEEGDRAVYLEALNDEEKSLCYQMLRDFYLSRPDAKRQRSVREAMVLFNQALLAKSRLWVERRWDPISRIIGTITEALANKVAGTQAAVAGDVSLAIGATPHLQFDSVLTLRKLIDLIGIFDFSGIAILIDKVDETDATTNSVDKTAELIHPLLARVQLMEIDRFSWIFFLWQKVKGNFEGESFEIRLDKIGHTSISWSNDFFAQMLNRRVMFFSQHKIDFAGLFSREVDSERVKGELVRVSMRSPRDVIRLMDTIVREHDVIHSAKEHVVLLDDQSIMVGIDKYVTDIISSIYEERLLAQIFRLNKTTFSNRDVQLTFKVGPQSARNRIQSWENAGIIKLSGTRAAEGPLGGKPANEYSIVDAKIEWIMQRQLVRYDGEVAPAEDFQPINDQL